MFGREEEGRGGDGLVLTAVWGAGLGLGGWAIPGCLRLAGGGGLCGRGSTCLVLKAVWDVD